MKPLRFAILMATIALVALSEGCASVSYDAIQFDVLRPAAYTMPHWVDSVVIANAATETIFDDKSIAQDNNIIQGIADACQKNLPLQICRNLKNDINNSGYLKASLHEGLIPSGSLRDKTIDSILTGHPSTIIIALSQLKATTDIEISDEVNDDDEQCGTMTCATTTRFKIIVAPGQEKDLDIRHDTLDYIGCGYSVRNIVMAMPSVANKYNEIGANSAQRTADLLIPAWERVRRRVYVTNNANMAAAEQWIKKGNWDEARNLWIKTATSANKTSDRVRAALNTALSFEREDDAAKASVWCSKALDILDKADSKTQKTLQQERKMGEAMFAYLVERMKQKAALDAQM